jgi:hypothetical protein
MARFLRRIALANEDLPASGSRNPFDLPVNPISHILLRFQVTNTSPAALDTASVIDDIITQITDVTVRHNGENIIQGQLRDIAALNARAFGLYPGVDLTSTLNAALRSVVFPICLGRRPYDPKSCFPATQRGNLQMLFTAGADGAGYSDINVSVEAIELIEAEPEEYVKYTTRSATSVVGDFDVRLPIGNPIMGVLMFDTGLFGSTDEVTSWGQVKLLKDNVEQYYAQADIEVLAAEFEAMVMRGGTWKGHQHQFNGAAAGLDQSDDADLAVSTGLQGYAYMDFDPTGDKTYILETAGASDLLIKGNGDEATAIRTLPIEVVSIKK